MNLAPECSRTSGRATLLCAAAGLAAGLTAALVPVPAHAGLIAAPGPWPVPVAGAVNPLIGSPHAFNGGHATGNAQLRVWLPVGRSQRASITRTIGGRTIVRGRLLNRDTRRSISGATVTLVAHTLDGGSWTAIENVRTTRRGTFRAVLPPGHHRRAAVLYYPTIVSATPVASRRLLVRSRARVYLARPYGNGRSFRFDGRVAGASDRTPRVVISLQVRNSSGNWLSPRSTTARSNGRYRIRYRFARRGTYAVRIFVKGDQTEWPMYAGRSIVHRIRAR